MTNPDFKSIVAGIDDDLTRVDVQMKKMLTSDVHMVDKVVRYIVKHKGKTLRPILTILASKLFGETKHQTIQAAVILELLHTATLVHDDVVDDSKMRRGFFSINAIWKNKVSVLVGDYLLAKSLSEMLDLHDFIILEIFSTVAKRMSRGELLQAAKTRKLDITEEVYFDMIGDKTAALLGACCELGAVTSGCDDDQREQLRQFGEKIGLAFQIRDDVLDFIGRGSMLGKPTMGDVKEKKITLPLIHAVSNCNNGDGRRIIKMIKRGVGSEKSSYILEFIHKYNGIDYAIQVADNLKQQAFAHLQTFPDTQSRSSLKKFAEFTITREK